MNHQIKKIIAREGMIFLVVMVLAFYIADSNSLKNLMMDIGVVKPRPNQADAVLLEAKRAGFYFSLIVYGCSRFVVWAIKVLRHKP